MSTFQLLTLKIAADQIKQSTGVDMSPMNYAMLIERLKTMSVNEIITAIKSNPNNQEGA